jgi:hypothetical protein
VTFINSIYERLGTNTLDDCDVISVEGLKYLEVENALETFWNTLYF